MKVVEIRQELNNNTSFEKDMFDINRLSRHIISVNKMSKDISDTYYTFLSILTSKVLDILDTIDYIVSKEVLENVEYKE